MVFGPVLIACSILMMASMVETLCLYPYCVFEVTRYVIFVSLLVISLDHIL